MALFEHDPAKLLRQNLAKRYQKQDQEMEIFINNFHMCLTHALTETSRDEKLVESLQLILTDDKIRDRFLKTFRKNFSHEEKSFCKTLKAAYLKEPQRDFEYLMSAMMENFRRILESDGKSGYNQLNAEYFTHHVWVALEEVLVTGLLKLVEEGK